MSENTGPGSDQPFTYPSSAGAVTVPSMSRIPAGVIRKTRKLEELDQVFTILEAVLDEAGLAVLDQMTSQELNDFSVAWQNHSGVSVGESAAS